MKKLTATVLVCLCALLLCSCAGVGGIKDIFANGADDMSDKYRQMFETVAGADEALAAAKENGAVVMEDMKCTSGEDAWEEFYERTQKGRSASILCADYYTLDREHVSEELYEEEKDKYPALYYTLVEYNGERYTVTTRGSDQQQPESSETYKYLMHYTGDALSPYASYSTYDYYVLVDDPDVTWEDIERGMFSSQYGDWIRHCSVYRNTFGDGEEAP